MLPNKAEQVEHLFPDILAVTVDFAGDLIGAGGFIMLKRVDRFEVFLPVEVRLCRDSVCRNWFEWASAFFLWSSGEFLF